MFVAPWARGHRLAARLVQAVEKKAKALGYYNLTLDIRSTQESAIQLYEGQGFKRWGTNPAYAFVDESLVSGHYYSKELRKIHCKTRRKKEA